MSTCEIPDGSALERRTPNREHWVRVAVPVCLLVLAQLPLLVLYGAMLWSRPHYRFFPLVLVGAAALAFAEIRGAGPCRPGPLGLSLGLVGLSWLLLAIGILLYIPWFGAVAGLVTLLAVIHGIGGGWLVVTPPACLGLPLDGRAAAPGARPRPNLPSPVSRFQPQQSDARLARRRPLHAGERRGHRRSKDDDRGSL